MRGEVEVVAYRNRVRLDAIKSSAIEFNSDRTECPLSNAFVAFRIALSEASNGSLIPGAVSLPIRPDTISCLVGREKRSASVSYTDSHTAC